jgi:multidrug resistance protein
MAWFSAKRSVLGVVGLAFFTDALAYAMLPPFLPEYARSLALSQTRLGLLYGVYAGSLLLATLPLGTWTDRRGRRGPFLGGLAGFAAATVLFAYGGSFTVLVLARALQGIAAAATWVAGLAMLADHFPAGQRGKAMSTAFACSNLGLLLGPAFSGLMVRSWSIRTAFLWVAGLTLLDAVARLLLLPKDSPVQPASAGYLALLKDRPVRVYAGTMGMGAVLGAGLEAVLPLHLSRHLGMDALAIGLGFASAALASGFTSPLVGHWTDRRGPAGPVRAGLLLGAGLLCAAPLLPGPAWVFLLMFGVGGACSLLMSPCGPALATRVEQLGGSDFGAVFSLLNITFSLGMVVGPVLGSLLTDGFGLRAAMALLAAGFLLYLPLLAGVKDRSHTGAVPLG